MTSFNGQNRGQMDKTTVMSIPNTSKRSHVEPFHAMDVLAAATKRKQAGHDVIFMSVGQPSAPAPKRALLAAEKAIADGRVGYTDALGLHTVREAIANYYQNQYGILVEPERVAVTTGSSAGFNLAFLTLFDPGDRVAIATPGYPAYRNILKAMSLNAIEIETDAPSRWTLTSEQIRKAHAEHGLAGVMVASPANPTGTMISPQALKELVETCRELGIWFISDEIYHRLTYEQETGLKEETALRFSDDVIVINSFSKYFCMTGWRIGWMILPQRLIRSVQRIAQSLYISAPEISQVAGAAALDAGSELERVRRGYLKNRALLMTELPRLGFNEITPIDGAFYAYARTSNLAPDSMDFAKRMLNEANVAATPGLDFDPVRGSQFMRFSFAGSYEEMEAAIANLQRWLGGK